MKLPTLPALPVHIAVWGGIGYIYGIVFNLPPELTTKVFAISTIANTLFFSFVKLPAQNERDIQAIYVCTNSIVNGLTILAMRRLNLIAREGTLILTSFMIINFLSRKRTMTTH